MTMKLNVGKNELFQELQIVQSAISNRTILPILGNILFEAGDGILRLTATDLEVAIRTQVRADIVEPGSITIPAKLLTEFLRTTADNKDLKITMDDQYKVEVRSGRNRINITGLPVADYPVIPTFDPASASVMPRKMLGEMLRKTMLAASTDETKYILNGVSLTVANGIANAAAADGLRFAFIQRSIENKNWNAKVILPVKGVQEILKLVGDDRSTDDNISMVLADNQASFFNGKCLVMSHLIEGDFPSFTRAIPMASSIHLKLNRQELLSSVSCAAVGTMELGLSIKFFVSPGVLRIQGSAHGRVEAESELTIDYAGADFTMSLNPTFIMDVLKTLESTDITLDMTGPLVPAVIMAANDAEYKYIMAPMVRNG